MMDPVPTSDIRAAEIAMRIDAFMAARYREHRIPVASHPWHYRFAPEDGDDLHADVWIEPHGSDEIVTRAGCVNLRHSCMPIDKEGELDPKLAAALDADIETLGRMIDRERRIAADGFDPRRPPAGFFLTDVITLAVLKHRRVDLDMLVADAPTRICSPLSDPRPEFSPRIRIPRNVDLPRVSAALPVDFPLFEARLHLDTLETRCLDLHDRAYLLLGRDRRWTVRVRDEAWPESVISKVVGDPIGRWIVHSALQDERLVIEEVMTGEGRMDIIIANPTVPLT